MNIEFLLQIEDKYRYFLFIVADMNLPSISISVTPCLKYTVSQLHRVLIIPYLNYTVSQVLRSSAFEGMLLKATWPGNEAVPQSLLDEIIKHSIPAFKYGRAVRSCRLIATCQYINQRISLSLL